MKTLYLREWLVIAVILLIMLSVSLITYLSRRETKVPVEKIKIMQTSVKR